MVENAWNSFASLMGLDANTLNAGQMLLRAVLTFMVTIAILRLGNKRLLGKGTAFDYIVAIMIGSVMSRAITGSSPLFATWVAGSALIGLHGLLSYLTSRLDWFGPIVKGNSVQLVRDGEVLEDGMLEGSISRNDLDQAIREAGSNPDPSNIEIAVLERNGSISVVPRARQPQVVDVSVDEGVKTVRIELN